MPDGVWVEIVQGQSAESIAYQSGHFTETLWKDANNRSLRDLRGDPNTLNPGDRLYIPPLRERAEACPADQRHRFRRRGVPSRLTITVRLVNHVLANRPYRLELSRGATSGVTSDTGQISVPVLPDEPDALLVIDAGHAGELRFAVGLRRLDPVTEVTGIQGRLRNLGYYQGEVHGFMNAALSCALVDFQIDERLPSSGAADDPTRARLLAKCGC